MLPSEQRFELRLAFFLQPGIEIHQTGMQLVQGRDICLTTIHVQPLEIVGILGHRLKRCLGVGDEASGGAADGGGDRLLSELACAHISYRNNLAVVIVLEAARNKRVPTTVEPCRFFNNLTCLRN